MSMELDALEKLKSSYSEGEKHSIQKTSKEAAIRRLREIEEEIMALPDLDHYPEGPDGIIIYCMLRSDALKCPDVGDFNYLQQGYEKIVRISFGVISEETRWFSS
jgi:hypothetical protein